MQSLTSTAVFSPVLSSFLGLDILPSLPPAPPPLYPFQGYQKIIANCHANARYLCGAIEQMGRFTILSKEEGVPLCTFALKDKSKFSEYDIASHLRQFGWIVPAYTMAPSLEHVSMLRVLVREDFSRTLADRFLRDLQYVVDSLTAHPPPEPTKPPPPPVLPPAAGQSVPAAAVKPIAEDEHHVLNKKALEGRSFRVHKKFGIPKTNGVC